MPCLDIIGKLLKVSDWKTTKKGKKMIEILLANERLKLTIYKQFFISNKKNFSSAYMHMLYSVSNYIITEFYEGTTR